MNEGIPQIDRLNSINEGFSLLEYKHLEIDLKAKKNLNDDSKQRYVLRWWAVILASVLILFMFYLFIESHVQLKYSEMNGPISYYLVTFVTPIVSLNILLIVFMTSVFRGISPKDKAFLLGGMEKVIKGSSGSIQ